jgi:hypothetical protein
MSNYAASECVAHGMPSRGCQSYWIAFVVHPDLDAITHLGRGVEF